MTNNSSNYDNLYYTIGLIFGILMGWTMTESVLWTVICAILGLVLGGFFANVIAKGEDA